MTALQLLPPRQLAVLILRDVLGFHANEVAGMLDSTVESVNSALKRARASLQRQQPPGAGREPPPAPGSPAEDALVAKFVRAYESAKPQQQELPLALGEAMDAGARARENRSQAQPLHPGKPQ